MYSAIARIRAGRCLATMAKPLEELVTRSVWVQALDSRHTTH